MTKNNKKAPTVPIDIFVDAFCKLMKVTREEFDIETDEENRSAFVTYNQQPYKINTYEYLLDGVKSMLTNIDEAGLIHTSIWAEVSIGILSNSHFYLDLIDALEDNDQAFLLQLAITISSIRPNDDDLFWYALERLNRLDKTCTLFGSAVVTAAKMFDLDRIADDVLDSQILNGTSVYNHLESGIFEEVTVPGHKGEDITLYIYSQDF